MPETYLVTGGAGFIGSHLAEALVRQGARVCVLDNFITGKRENLAGSIDRITLIDGDITDLATVCRAVAGVDYVLHQAALPSVPRSVADPLGSNAANVTGTLNVLVAARDAGVKRVVYAASSSAYGNIQAEFKREDMPPDPRSPYAVAKLAGEQYCRAFYLTYGLETVSLRYFNVFGPRQDPASQYAAVIPIFITAMLRGESPPIEGDGQQSRDFTFIDDVVHANLLACAAPDAVGETMNIACGGRQTILSLVEILNDLLETDLAPAFLAPRPGDVRHSRADIGKAERLLGYRPQVAFVDGLAQTLHWYRQADFHTCEEQNMSERKLLHVIKATGVAGAEAHVLALLTGLRAADLDAELLALVEPGNPVEALFARAAALGVPAHRLTIGADFDPRLFPRLRRFIAGGGYRLIHTHLIHADVYGIPAARRAGAPCVVSTRHNDNPFRRAAMRLLNRWLWSRVDRGIAISEYVRRFCIEVEGAPDARMTTVYYGLDPAQVRVGKGAREVLLAELGVSPATPLAGSVCRLNEQKGVDVALRAFWQIAETVPNVHYVIAGDGPLRGALEEQARGFGLTDRVHFLGWRDDPYAVIAGLDVLVVPSLWEGFGLVLLEAMALRVPVVASRVSAIPEIVADGETGLLVEPGDAAGLASALCTLIIDRALAAEMGAQGRARLEQRFTAARMVEETRAVYGALGVQ